MATILIIDDRPMNLEFLCMILKYMNHQVLTAENGMEGLEKLKNHTVDLIISDILMPYVDGCEFARLVKLEPHYQHIPIIFYTAIYRKEEADMLANDLGVQYVIAKPAEPQVIIDTINEALGMQSEESKIVLSPEKTILQASEKQNWYPGSEKNADLDEKFQALLAEIALMKSSLKSENENFVMLAEHLIRCVHYYRDFNCRLLTVNQLNFDMISIKEPQQLLNYFCTGVQRLSHAQFGVVGVFESKGTLRYLALSSPRHIDIEKRKQLLTLNHPWVANIIGHQRAFSCNELNMEEPIDEGLIKSMIAAPLLTKNELYGFAYFINKESGDTFDEEDIQLLDSLAATLSIYYENIELYSLIQGQAAKLQIESSTLKRTKEELGKSEMMFRQFAENIKDVFWRTNANMDEIIYVSPGYEEIWGKSIESIYDNPRSWQEAVVEEDKKIISKLSQKQIVLRKEDTFQFRIKRPDGKIRHIYNKVFAIQNEKGELNNIIGIASDITEYLRNQQCIVLEKNIRKILERSATFNKAAVKILKSIGEVFDWDMGEAWLLDEDEEMLRLSKRWHKVDNRFKVLDQYPVKGMVRSGEGLVGQIWQEARPIWNNECSAEIDAEKAQWLSTLGLSYVIGFPLLSQDKVFGVMVFYAHQAFLPENDFLEILIMLGARIGEFLNQKLTQAQLLQIAKQGGIRMLF